jgi:hypothetical protein
MTYKYITWRLSGQETSLSRWILGGEVAVTFICSLPYAQFVWLQGCRSLHHKLRMFLLAAEPKTAGHPTLREMARNQATALRKANPNHWIYLAHAPTSAVDPPQAYLT